MNRNWWTSCNYDGYHLYSSRVLFLYLSYWENQFQPTKLISFPIRILFVSIAKRFSHCQFCFDLFPKNIFLYNYVSHFIASTFLSTIIYIQIWLLLFTFSFYDALCHLHLKNEPLILLASYGMLFAFSVFRVRVTTKQKHQWTRWWSFRVSSGSQFDSSVRSFIMGFFFFQIKTRNQTKNKTNPAMLN